MKIYHKDIWGFWFFKRYSLYVEDESESLTEILTDKNTWIKYNVGDIYKNVEQRVEELEKEVKFLKTKNKLNDTSIYLKNYPEYNNPNEKDYVYNLGVNLMSKPDLETSFASPWDSPEEITCPLNPVRVGLSSTTTDSLLPNPNYVDSFDIPSYYPEYPNIIGSWDDNPKELIDEYGFKMNYEPQFLKYLNFTEKKIEKEFGKIISKFKILIHEWEMDGYGYIVNNGANNQILVTDHNKLKVVNEDYLNNKIKEYNEVIQETKNAIELFNTNGRK